MQKLKNEINEKKQQMHVLEQRMVGSLEVGQHPSNNNEISQVIHIVMISETYEMFQASSLVEYFQEL